MVEPITTRVDKYPITKETKNSRESKGIENSSLNKNNNTDSKDTSNKTTLENNNGTAKPNNSITNSLLL